MLASAIAMVRTMMVRVERFINLQYASLVEQDRSDRTCRNRDAVSQSGPRRVFHGQARLRPDPRDAPEPEQPPEVSKRLPEIPTAGPHDQRQHAAGQDRQKPAPERSHGSEPRPDGA